MRKSLIISLLATAALVVVASTAQGQSADPWIGTWKVNLAKSTYSPGPAPKTAGTVKIDSAPNGIKTTIDGADARVSRHTLKASLRSTGKTLQSTALLR